MPRANTPTAEPSRLAEAGERELCSVAAAFDNENF
jgi:hypothetical protein